MAKQYPECGKYGSKLCWLVGFFRFNGFRYEDKLGRGVYGKELETMLNETNEPPAGYTFEPISLKGAPVPYEIQKGMSNWIDCIDWVQDNLEYFKANYPQLAVNI
jgi:hypothetical protein